MDGLRNDWSFDSVSTPIVYTDHRFHLQLAQKKEQSSERPVIHSTMWQRLSFYRAFSTTSSKTDIITKQEVDINSFLWSYAATVFFNSLPHSFVHYFLAAYAPDEHLFVAKMVPIAHGIKYLVVITCFLEMVAITDFLLLLFYFVIHGPLEGNPWNRCKEDYYFDDKMNVTVHCYDIESFALKFINKSDFIYLEFAMIDSEGEIFISAQMDFYRYLATPALKQTYIGVHYFVFVWLSLNIVPFLIGPHKNFWKMFMIMENVLICLDLISLMYILVDSSPVLPQVKLPPVETNASFWNADLEMLAQGITAPPIVHVLTSRSNQEINPSADSAVMVLSNAINYIFRGMLGNKMRRYVESKVHAEIPVTFFNEHTVLFIMPMFFTNFYWGDMFSMLYFTTYLIVEYSMIVATYVCIIEPIVYEWPKVKRWMVSLTFFVGGFVSYFFITNDSRVILWAYAKGIVAFAETFFLYMLYPVGRLVDDFTFHYGVSLTELRMFSLRLVPVYFSIKLYIQLASLWEVLETTSADLNLTHYVWSWLLMVLPIALGMIYIIYKYRVIFRTTWSHIFRPLPKWGPQDFSVRQLRKQYHSKYYIGSEAPRLLSRYLMTKKDSKVYKVDVQYDFFRRSSTGAGMKVAFGETREKQE